MTIKAKTFQKKILRWFAQHGRTTLPWQQHQNAYAIWVSEIMLQQTQVTTVIPYFTRFMERFPSVDSLANASLDTVLHLWTGLGYYRRARLLHEAAGMIHRDNDNVFPQTLEGLMNLPGIGRSTAASILSFAYGQSATILDGNVKRVLSRFACIGHEDGSTSVTKLAKRLWELATHYTPQDQCGDYNQAMIDLGALVCTRSKPDCPTCPLIKDCQAYQQQRIAEFPAAKIKKERPIKHTIFLILCNPQDDILLIQRPPVGIWGGLWSLPECEKLADINKVCQQDYQQQVLKKTMLQEFTHTFTHFHLHAKVFLLDVKSINRSLHAPSYVWHDTKTVFEKGLPAPIVRILQNLRKNLLPQI